MKADAELPLDFQSVVDEPNFNSREAVRIFKYLRQKEKIYARDILRWKDFAAKTIEARSKYQEVTAMLVWIVTNIPNSEWYGDGSRKVKAKYRGQRDRFEEDEDD